MDCHEARWVSEDLLVKIPFRFRFHSVYQHAVNFLVEGRSTLLMIADPDMYRGPSSLGLSHEGFSELRRILNCGSSGIIESDGFMIEPGNLKYTISSETAVADFAAPSKLCWNKPELASSLKLIDEALQEHAYSNSSIALLKKDTSESLFSGALRRSFPSLVSSIATGNESLFAEACSELVGLGHGSTPTGDDLIHGALVADFYYRRAHDLPWRPLTIPQETLSKTTSLGQHMLVIGIQGLTPEPVRNYLLELFDGNADSALVNQLRRIGASTGLDIAVGALLMLEELSRQGKSLEEGRR